MIKRSKEFAQHWLNASHVLRKALTSNSTQQILREVSRYSHHYPHILEDFSANLSKYINTRNSYVKRGLVYNETILRYLNQSRARLEAVVKLFLLDKSGSNRFLEQLSFIDRAAMAWLTVLKPIKFDIFYGFRNEEALMRYYGNSSKQINFRKFVLSGTVRYCCQ